MAPRLNHGSGSLVQPSNQPKAIANETLHFGRSSGFNAGLPIVGEVMQVFVDVRITSALALTSHKHAIWYYTKLARTTRICGTPEVSLDITPNAPKWQLVIYLWHVDFLDVGTLVSHGSVTCWNCTAGERITRKIQLRTMCEDVSGGLGLGIDMFSELYVPPNTDPKLQVALHYSDQFSVSLPEVLSGGEVNSASIVVV